MPAAVAARSNATATVTTSTTQSPRDVALTPLRQWVLAQQAHSMPFLLFLQRKRTPQLTQVMKFASFTGTEDFYAPLLMFAVWIVNGKLGLTIGYCLALGFCFCNVIKDILRLPRPPPPIVPLERAFDWGFPSHHALMVTCLSLCMGDTLLKEGLMLASSIPTFLLLATAWVCSVGLSRLYVGVHSIADLSAGVLTGLALAAFYTITEGALDRYVLSDAFRFWHIAAFALVLFLTYPIAQPATTTFLDCMVTLGAAAGCALARNRMQPEGLLPSLFELPASSFSSAYTPYFCATARLAIGFSLVMSLRQLAKMAVPLVLRPVLCMLAGEENFMQNVTHNILAQPSFTHRPPAWHSKSGVADDVSVTSSTAATTTTNGETAPRLSATSKALLVYLPRIQYLHDAMLRFIVYCLIAWASVEAMPRLYQLIGI